MEERTKDIWLLHFATFFFFMGLISINPLISPLAIIFGATPLIVGSLASISSAVSLIFKPISGIISDRGFKFEVMLLGTFLAALSGIIYIASTLMQSIAIFAIGRALHGLAMAMFFPASLSTAVDLAPPSRVGETLGWRSTMFGISQLFGPAFGGFIADLYGFTIAFLLTVVFSLIGFILVFIPYRKDRMLVKKREKGKGFKIKSLTNIAFLIASIGVFINAFAYSNVITFLPALYKSIGLGTSAFGIYASVVGGFSIFTRIFGGREADKRGPALVASVGFGLMTGGFILLNSFTTPPLSYLSAVLLGMGLGFVVPALQFLALGNLPKEVRGFGASIYTMFFDLGFMSGPVLLGYYIQLKGSYEAVFPLLPIIAAFALITMQIVKMKK